MSATGRRYRRETLVSTVEKVEITVPQMSMTTLVRRAIAHYNRRNPAGRPASLDSDTDFLCRLMVNYLRHQCSEYDSLRTFLRQYAHDGDHEFVGAVVKGRVLRMIAAQYPALHDEARNQAVREDRVVNGQARAGGRGHTTTVRQRR